MYIAEVAPSNYRGGLVSVNQLAIVIGVLAAQLVNLVIYNYAPVAADLSAGEIVESWNGQTGWRIMFAAEVIPALAFFVLAFVIPESPRWLASRSRNDESLEILARIGGSEYAGNELKNITESLTAASESSLRQLFASGSARWLLAFGLFIAAFQQWCGINVIFNYAEEIFWLRVMTSAG